MQDLLNNAAILVHLASLLYVIAFVVREQLLLRGLVLVATGLYIGYYYFAPATPLWDAIAWSLILVLANVWVMLKLITERTTIRMSEDEKKLFSVFANLSPGEFRKLLKITHWHNPVKEETLTTEGQPLDRLICVLEGEITVNKLSRTFNLPAVSFIGEVTYFRGVNATATTKVSNGARYVSWLSNELRALQSKEPGIRVAMFECLNQDMANKVAAS